MGGGYKVLVSGISLDISKDDVIGMFLKYGDMVTIFFDDRNVKGQRCGYVVYQTKLECYRAISELNGQPPHFWDLRFGALVEYDDCPKGSGVQPQLVSMQCPSVLERPQSHLIKAGDTCTSGKNISHGKDINWSRIVVEEESKESNSKHTQIENQVRSASISMRENELMISSPPESDVDSEMRSQGIPQLVQTFSKCTYCAKPGDESCSECHTTYCSRKCQVDDWKRHKLECTRIKLGILNSPPSKETSAIINRTIYGAGEEVKGLAQKNKSEMKHKNSSFIPEKDEISGKSHLNREFSDRANETVPNHGHRRGKARDKCNTFTEIGVDLSTITGSKDYVKSFDTSDSSYEDLSTSCGENTVLIKGTKRTVKRKIKLTSNATNVSTLKSPERNNEENIFNRNDASKSSGQLDRSNLGINVNKFQEVAAKKNISESAFSMEEKLISDADMHSLFPKPVIKTLDEPKMALKKDAYKSNSQTIVSDSCDAKDATPKAVANQKTDEPSNVVRTKLPELMKLKVDIPDFNAWNQDTRMRNFLHESPASQNAHYNPYQEKKELPSDTSTSPTATQTKPPSLLELKIEDPRISKWDKIASEWNLLSDNPDTKIVSFDLCTKQKQLAPDVFTLVQILSFASSEDFWVSCVDAIEELEVIQELLLNKKQISEAPYKPSVGDYCCVSYKESLFRSKVLSKKENEVLVFLIDCGRVVPTVAELVWELPTVAKNYYAQAIHVKMDERTPNVYLKRKEGDKMGVKPIGTVQEGVTKVQMEGVLYAQDVFVPKLLSLPSVGNLQESKGTDDTVKESQWPFSSLALLTNGHSITCTVLQLQMNEENGRDGMIITLGFEEVTPDLESILRDLPNDCCKLKENPKFKPSVGEMVAAYCYRVDNWVRSIVLASGNMRWLVACLDFGIIEEVSYVREIPKQMRYREAFSLSAKCTITKSLFPREDLFSEGRVEVHSSLFGKVVKKEENKVECKLELSGSVVEELCTVTLEAWTPDVPVNRPKDDENNSLVKPLEYVQLTPGCPVKLVSYFNCLVMYVQPCDVGSKHVMDDLHRMIAVLAEKNGPLKKMPIKGKVYTCQYSGDLRYYRAVVSEVKDKSEIHVKYIDYGNEEKVPLSRLYELPSEYAEIPCYGVKIELRKDISLRLNLDCQIYLSYLILEDRELILEYPEGNLRCAELFRRNHSLSKILQRFINQ